MTVFCATVLYPNKEGATFDVDGYVREIAPRYAKLLGENCFAHEVRRGLAVPGSGAPPYLCIASFWITSRELFGVALGQPAMKELMAEIAAFSDIRPLRQFDEQVLGQTSARA